MNKNAEKADRGIPEKQTKIIAVTANAMEGDRQICLAAGVCACAWMCVFTRDVCVCARVCVYLFVFVCMCVCVCMDVCVYACENRDIFHRHARTNTIFY